MKTEIITMTSFFSKDLLLKYGGFILGVLAFSFIGQTLISQGLIESQLLMHFFAYGILQSAFIAGIIVSFFSKGVLTTESRLLLSIYALFALGLPSIAQAWSNQQDTINLITSFNILQSSLLFLGQLVVFCHIYKPRLEKHLLSYVGIFSLLGFWSQSFSSATYLINVLVGALFATLLHLTLLHTGWISTLAKHLHNDIEYRRQLAHFATGSIIAVLMYMGILTTTMLSILLIAGGISVILVKRKKLRHLTKVLKIFERPHHLERFPGRGVFYMVLAALIVSVFFSTKIAVSAMIILSIGDSLTNIVGRDLGKIPFFYNPQKNIEGPIVGAICSALGVSLLYPLHIGISAAFVALFIESLPLTYKGFEIDDNITIPIASALVILLMTL